MGVRKEHRRRIEIDGRLHVWWVEEDAEGAGPVLHVISEDKKLMVMYALDQKAGSEYIVVLGPEFAGAETGGVWRRFRSPSWVENGSVTPRKVRELIDWCRNEDEPRTPAEVGIL